MALIHGGDAEGFRLEKGYEPIDFSANCNPLGVPDGVIRAICEAARHADEYPDPLCRRLISSISEFEGVSPQKIMCGNGSADLIFRLAFAIKPKRALVTSPTFAEYEAALKAVDCQVDRHILSENEGFKVTGSLIARLTEDIDVIFLCNPNNPTGLVIDPLLLRQISEECDKRNIMLIVDECFNGFLDDPIGNTMKYRLDSHNLIILKAFTKLYGMAGIRLGYCLTGNTGLIERMRKSGQPWSVSSLAQEAGIAALKETEYVQKARALIQTEKNYLAGELRYLGFDVFGKDANYIFFRGGMVSLAEILRDKGILIRDCSNFADHCRGYYRIAVRTHKENTRLIDALKECMGMIRTNFHKIINKTTN